MEVAINNNIYKQASDFAEKQGLNLTSVIEDFLKRFIILMINVSNRETKCF